MLRVAYRHDPHRAPHSDLLHMRSSKQDLLNYAKDVLKYTSCNDLAKLDCEDLYTYL